MPVDLLFLFPQRVHSNGHRIPSLEYTATPVAQCVNRARVARRRAGLGTSDESRV